ncbi:MAG: hypothetical protein ACMG6H_02785 [Acidobacteriota bacterium]
MTGAATSGAAGDDNNNKPAAAAVLVGPCGLPGAMGPGGVNDDFTNRSLNTGIANVAPGGLTTAAGTVVFRNTVQNLGVSDDVFIISAPSAPAGFKIEISTDDGETYATVETWSTAVTVPVAYHAAATFLVRVTAPAGLKILTGFDTVIRVTSTVNTSVMNDTIDRLYTGFIRIDRKATIINSTGSGGATDAVPGAEIEFAITYANISAADGVGSAFLTAHNLVISENGSATANNWAATTEHVLGATDSQGGIVLGDRLGSSFLSDMIMTLEAGQTGVFKFRRRIK